jgi:hypothetical protein
MSDNPVQVRVCWYGPSNWIGRLICRVTRSQYCHVGICLGSDYYEAVNPRVRKLDQPPTGIVADWTGRVPPDPASFARTFLEREVDRRYSWTTIAADLLGAYTGQHWTIEREGEHVCSALVAWALLLAEVFDSDAPETETPGSLADKLGAVPTVR